ncbi:hypothetical protein IWX49DRAFT_432328 [Phyllosticta citricarpa]|uniref:Uncharacterized protein n=2 Tax=Phyllosticta TaxID=121621 RepID=A0ABR1MDE6_9PEZI
MRFSTIATAAMAATGAVAAHQHSHARLHDRRAAREAELKIGAELKAANELKERSLGSVLLAVADEAKIIAKGLVAIGENAVSSGSSLVWIGSDGKWTNTYHNQADEDCVLVVWGSAGSWVNAKAPLVTVSIPAGENKTLSFADGASGAWAVMYEDTELVNGQISQTWGEYTFGEYGVVDVSREVNMQGHNMTIQTPNCVTDMETCVFVCKDPSSISCWLEYELKNCENGSQEGANKGTYAGADSGGCGNMGDSADLHTYVG